MTKTGSKRQVSVSGGLGYSVRENNVDFTVATREDIQRLILPNRFLVISLQASRMSTETTKKVTTTRAREFRAAQVRVRLNPARLTA